MVTDSQDQREPQQPSRAEGTSRLPVRGPVFLLMTVALATVSLVAATGAMVCWLRPPGDEGGPAEAEMKLPAHLFRGWPKPDVALVLSSQQHGYLLPCGCSRPQKGGLERRYNLVQLLRDKGWLVAAVDGGDVPQVNGPQGLPNVQGPIKYHYSMEALKLIGYAAAGIGPNELAMPLERAITEWALNDSVPRVLTANYAERNNIPDTIFSYKIATPAGSDIRVGVIGVVGHTVAKEVKDPRVSFTEVKDVLPGALKELAKEKPDLKVLLYAGSTKEALACAEAFPDFQVVLCHSAEDEPSAKPERVGNTLVIGVGHKGKHVGVLGVNRTEKGTLALRYELVELGEEYMTPEGQEARNPIIPLMERYTKELKDEDYLHRYGKTNHAVQAVPKYADSTYVGSQKCKACHKDAFNVWQESKHAHAYASLVTAKRPSLRQYDAECVVCHVVGFTSKGGFTDELKTAHLTDVGCESCHGPASLHVKAATLPTGEEVGGPMDDELRALMNPWKALPNESETDRKARILRVDQGLCQKCHDIDNDVKWDFDIKWPKVAHPSPRE